MAKPRVFISSTFYDLQQIRANLDQFIEDLGYESIRNEEGDIAYGTEEKLEEYCYKEVSSVDIFVNIIGGRFGTLSSNRPYSITQQELKTALDVNKQVYIFIQKDVLYEYKTYLRNKTNKHVEYQSVDNPKIFEFLEEIYSLQKNNNIKGFETSSDITRYLKAQFAGLFQRFLSEQVRLKEYNLIKRLEDATKNVDGLVSYLRNQQDGQKDDINKILKMNHPLVNSLKENLKIPYNFYIEGFDDLDKLLSARGYDNCRETTNDYIWCRESKNADTERVITISKKLFDDDKHLVFVKQGDWNEIYYSFEERKNQMLDDDDLPF